MQKTGSLELSPHLLRFPHITHLGQLLLQPAALLAQCRDLVLQGLPGLFCHPQGALQALPIHLLLQPQLFQPLLLLPSRGGLLLHPPLLAQQGCLFLFQLWVPVGVKVSERMSPAPPPREGGPTQDQGSPTHLTQTAQGVLAGGMGRCPWPCGHWGDERRKEGPWSFFSTQTMKEDRWTDGGGQKEAGSKTERYRDRGVRRNVQQGMMWAEAGPGMPTGV